MTRKPIIPTNSLTPKLRSSPRSCPQNRYGENWCFKCHAGLGTTTMYVLVTLAAILRLLAPLGGEHDLLMMGAAGAAWSGAFGLFVLLCGAAYAPAHQGCGSEADLNTADGALREPTIVVQAPVVHFLDPHRSQSPSTKLIIRRQSSCRARRAGQAILRGIRKSSASACSQWKSSSP
jgi:hypothetical protein